MVVGLSPERNGADLAFELPECLKIVSIAVCLLKQGCVRYGRVSAFQITVNADVKFGNLIVYPERGKHVDGFNNLRGGGRINLAVHLVTHAINRNSPLEQITHQLVKKLALRALGG